MENMDRDKEMGQISYEEKPELECKRCHIIFGYDAKGLREDDIIECPSCHSPFWVFSADDQPMILPMNSE
jgi:hypothetical protein